MLLPCIVLLGLLALQDNVWGVFVSQSTSKSHHSESKSHHSKSHHSRSKSHHSNSQSVSPSEAFITTCSAFSAPSPPLRFDASLLPLNVTCRGTKLPHEDNAKAEHPLLHDNLDKHWKKNWHARRECECTHYQVCVTTNCSNSQHNFEAISIFPAFARRLALPYALVNCVLLPYAPPPFPPGSNIPEDALTFPQVQCTVPHLNTTITGDIITPYPITTNNHSVNCTYSTAQTEVIDDVDVNLLICGAPTNFYACSQVVQPLNFETTLIDRATTCSHDHTHSGTPNDGAGKVAAWVLIGVVPIVIIIVVTVIIVRRRRRNGKRDEAELRPLKSRGPQPLTTDEL